MGRSHSRAMGELPDEFGKWNSVFKRFCRWVKADIFYHILKALAADADHEYAMIDGTIVKVHRSGQGIHANWLRSDLQDRGITPVISRNSTGSSRQNSTAKPTNGGI